MALGEPVMNRRRYGESMRERRARWKAAGLCRDCGAPVDGPGSSVCARHRKSRNRGNYLRRHVEFKLRLPGPLAHKCAKDAAERGETLHDWIVAELAALFEPEPDEAGE